MNYSSNNGLFQQFQEVFSPIKSVTILWLSRGRLTLCYLFFTFCLFSNQQLRADITDSPITDVTATDVTTRAFSIVWRFNEPVDSASVKVFIEDAANQDELVEITDTLNINLVSAITSSFHANGIIKMDVTGALANTTYSISVATTGVSGTFEFPSLIEVTTAAETTKSTDDGRLIVNDLIGQEMFNPDGSKSEATLMIVETDLSPYPLSAIVGNGYGSLAVVDLNNVFSKDETKSIEVPGGTPITITEFRGLLCNQDDHKLTRQRRAPVHAENPPITALELPAACFSPGGTSADFNCDSRIGLQDLGTLAARFGLEQPDCRFNPDFDFNKDGRIGLFDLGALAAAFGTSEE